MAETVETKAPQYLSFTKAPQYLSFTVARTDYGVPVLAVREILQHEEPTRVPGAPRSIRGVIDVRGQIVPVVDLAVKFGGADTVASSRTCILVVEANVAGEPLVLGVIADAVNEVLDLPPSEVEAAPTFGPNVRVHYLTGVGKIGRAFVLLVDLDRVLSAAEADAAAKAAQPAALAAATGAPEASIDRV